MPGKQLNPAQKIEAITLRSGGYPLAAIAECIRVFVNSLQRLFKSRSTPKGGVTDEAIANARNDLLGGLLSSDRAKEEFAKLIVDDLAHSRMIREQAAIVAEALQPTDTQEVALAMRAFVAQGTIIRNTSDTIRNHSRLNGYSSAIAEEMQALVIRDMTQDEYKAIEEEHKSLLAETAPRPKPE